MRDPTEKFIRTFEAIVTQVNERAGVPLSHSFEIEKAAMRDGIVRRNREVLIYIRNVRNALQHPKHSSDGHALQVSESFLEEVQDLLKHLTRPPTASSAGVPREKIKTASTDDRLGDLADEMKRGGFSHVPIVDECDVVIGVFNEAAVFDHLWADTETIVGRQMQIADILLNCSLDANHTEIFRFIKPATPVDDLVDMFLDLNSPTTRLGAAFVTASGKKSDPLQRLITPWDVLAISSN